MAEMHWEFILNIYNVIIIYLKWKESGLWHRSKMSRKWHYIENNGKNITIKNISSLNNDDDNKVTYWCTPTFAYLPMWTYTWIVIQNSFVLKWKDITKKYLIFSKLFKAHTDYIAKSYLNRGSIIFFITKWDYFFL